MKTVRANYLTETSTCITPRAGNEAVGEPSTEMIEYKAPPRGGLILLCSGATPDSILGMAGAIRRTTLKIGTKLLVCAETMW